MQREFLPHIFGATAGNPTSTTPSQTSASEIQMRNLSERIKTLDRIVVENDARVEKLLDKIKSFEFESAHEMETLRKLKGEIENTFRNLSASTETRYTTLESKLQRITEILKESLVNEGHMRAMMERTQSAIQAAETRNKQMKTLLDRKEAELLATRSLVGEMKAELERLKRI